MIVKRLFTALLVLLTLCAGTVSAEESPVSEPAEEQLPQEEETEKEAEAPAEEVPEETEEKPEEEKNDEPDAEEDKEAEPAVSDEEPRENKEEQANTKPQESQRLEMDETAGGETIDLHETTAHAAARLREEEESGIRTDTGILISKGKIASFDSLINEGSVEFIKLYFINDRPVYCVEPDVNLRLINGQGGEFTGRTWDSLDAKTRNKLIRIAYFGYGFPAVGTDITAYAATQALVWREVSTREQWQKIDQSLHMCEGVQTSFSACTVARNELDSRMETILYYTDHYDTVPSFAGKDHTVTKTKVKWNETLDLEDTAGVLDWFEDDSEESHAGITIQTRGNHLLVKIDDLYYEGHASPEGKVLTFQRKQEDWENVMNGLLLYEQGEQQKLMAAGGEDPVSMYQMAFSLDTGDFDLLKTDEYGIPVPGEDTAFLIGWKKNPGSHREEKSQGIDEDGSLLWPIREEGSDQPRLFRADGTGRICVHGLLPAGEDFWLKEAECGNAYELNPEPFPVKTGTGGRREEYRFANRLRTVRLEVRKRDGEDNTKINEAGFVIYDTGPMNPAVTQSGIMEEEENSGQVLSWRTLREHCSLKPGEKFVLGEYEYTIIEEKEDAVVVSVRPLLPMMERTDLLSRYQLPQNLRNGETFETARTVNMHASFAEADDEVIKTAMKVEDIVVREDRVLVLAAEIGAEDVLFTADLNEERPCYDDLPDARNLKSGDVFALRYPRVESDGTVVSESIEFTVCRNGPAGVKIRSDTQEYLVPAPVWIGPEDIPREGFAEEPESGSESMQEWEYEVMDERGAHYHLNREGTELLRQEEEPAYVSDISFAEVLEAEQAGDMESEESGFAFSRIIPRTQSIPYPGPQYSELSDEEKKTAPGEFIHRDDDWYEVKENDGISLTIAVIHDGREYLAELTPSITEQAFFTKQIPVSFFARRIDIPEASALSPEENETVHALREGDRFEKDGLLYFVVSKGETETELLYPWEREAPLTAEEVLNQRSEKDGVHYRTDTETINGTTLYVLTSLEDGRTFTYVREVIGRKKENEAEKVFEVKKPEGISFEELESERYGDKIASQHITVNETMYEIVSAEATEAGVVYEIKDESGTHFAIPDENGIELPITRELIRNTPCDLRVNDEIVLRHERMRILSCEVIAGVGLTVRLQSTKDGKRYEIRENPDPEQRETETLMFFETGKASALPYGGEACTWSLRTDNPHVSLSRAGKNWTVFSDANTSAVLECRDETSGEVSVKRAVFTSEEDEKTIEALAVFAGKTGHQYLRIKDSARQETKVIGLPVTLYADPSEKEKALSAVTDRYGAVDLSDLEEGTYWYRDPITQEEKNIAVLSAQAAEGELIIEGLKYGRTYVLIEESLPEGYDFQESEAFERLTMTPGLGVNTLSLSVENMRRRMMIQVQKKDEEEMRTPLNNAWFTAEDVTEERGSGQVSLSEVSLSDIPPGLRSGDLFPVWPLQEGEMKRTWRIEEIREEEITIALLENGAFEKTFRIPKTGYERGAPMLYADILRCTGVPKEGAVFETERKEDPSRIRTYRILSLECEPARDVFGNLSGEMTIARAWVEDTADLSHTPIPVGDRQTPAESNTFLGEFISGGILVKKEEKEEDVPIGLEELRSLGADTPGDSVKAKVRRAAVMPGYGMIRRVWEKGKTELPHGGVTWRISEPEDGVFEITAKEQRFAIYEQTIPGVLAWKEDGLVRVRSTEKENGRMIAAVIEDEAGNSWYLKEGMPPCSDTIGRAGVEVMVRKRSSSLVLHGYTGKDGRVLFSDLEDGDYEIESEGEKTFTHVERGKIFLPEIPYGHLIRICETKSPLGYLRGEACAVIQPLGEIGIDTVTNTRTNKRKTSRQEEIRKTVKVRKMGEMPKKTTAAVMIAMGLALLSAVSILRRKLPEAAEVLHLETSRSDEYVSDPEEETKTLKDWQKINPKVRYVLIFPDEAGKRTIPVVAEPSPEYAMKHNVRNEYDTMGSVFCDPSAVTPENLVIYGHSSKTKDWNFTFFRNYLNPEYYRAHPGILLEEESGTIPCRIVSFASYDLDRDVYCGWADTTLSGKDEITEMFQNTAAYLLQKTDGIVYRGEGIVTLVTCDMEENDTRFVIQALRQA